MKYLTESQIKNYNDDGFLLLKKLIRRLIIPLDDNLNKGSIPYSELHL